jgi:hypothetical protein
MRSANVFLVLSQGLGGTEWYGLSGRPAMSGGLGFAGCEDIVNTLYDACPAV